MLLLGKKALPPSVRPARSRLQWALSPNTAARLAAPSPRPHPPWLPGVPPEDAHPAPDPTPCPLPKTLTRRGRPPRAKEDTPCPTPPT